MLEEPVYDRTTRWVGGVVLLVFFVPIAAMLLWLRAMSQKHSSDLLMVVGFLALVNLGLFLVIHLSTNVWIKIDLADKTVSQLYKLFGWSVYRKIYDLSQFDHISLHRAFRGGYRATLVGREREVALAASWKLGGVRQAAERIATFSGLRLGEQL